MALPVAIKILFPWQLTLFQSPSTYFNMLVILSSKNAKQGHKTGANNFIYLLDHSSEAQFANMKNGTLKVARNAFNIEEVWNPVCCHGNKTFKCILCCTFSRTLLQKIKHSCYKLAEISFFIKSDQNLVEYNYDVITWLICIF